MYCRESNPVRTGSQLSRARKNFRLAVVRYRANPNVATTQKRAEMARRFLARRAKHAYVSGCCNGADFSAAHALGQAYQKANGDTDAYYQANIAL